MLFRFGLFYATLTCLANAQCPVEITKVNPHETQSWSRVGRGATMPKSKAGFMPPDFVVKLRNASGKDIRGIVFLAAAYDATEDLHIIPTPWNAATTVRANSEKTLKWDNFEYADTASTGWVVVPQKILFEDGSKWTYSANVQNCYGEYWRKPKHPRLTGLPDQILKKALEQASQ